jgi:hypothetical protein
MLGAWSMGGVDAHGFAPLLEINRGKMELFSLSVNYPLPGIFMAVPH